MFAIVWGIKNNITHTSMVEISLSSRITNHWNRQETTTQYAITTPENALAHPRIRVHNPISSRQRNDAVGYPGNASDILQDVRMGGICVVDTEDDNDHLNVHHQLSL